jgi:lactoylglutathione lyase
MLSLAPRSGPQVQADASDLPLRSGGVAVVAPHERQDTTPSRPINRAEASGGHALRGAQTGGQMITHIGSVAVYVADQAAARNFWTQQVGFEVKAERPMTESVSWVEVGPPGAASALVLYPKELMDQWRERKPSVVFITDDVDATCSRLADKGVVISQPVVEMAWGKFAAFLDTDGNEFGLRT